MIRVDRIWLATEALDMRSGADRMLARIIEVFGSAQPHQAYCFANQRATRMKVLVHDGVGVWVALRRLNRGRFVWAAGQQAHFQLDAGARIHLAASLEDAAVLDLESVDLDIADELSRGVDRQPLFRLRVAMHRARDIQRAR